MTGDDLYIPQHDRVTRLAAAFREHSNRVIENHLNQDTNQTAPNTPNNAHNMAQTTGDVTQVNIEKFT